MHAVSVFYNRVQRLLPDASAAARKLGRGVRPLADPRELVHGVHPMGGLSFSVDPLTGGDGRRETDGARRAGRCPRWDIRIHCI